MKLRKLLASALCLALLLGSLSVAGIAPAQAATGYTDVTVNDDNRIVTANNYINNVENFSFATDTTLVGDRSGIKYLFDGGVQGVNTTVNSQWFTWENIGGDRTLYLIYDFGAAKEINTLMVAGFGPTSSFSNLLLPAFELYVTDDTAAVQAGTAAATVSAAASTTKGVNSHLFTLAEAVTGRYLVLKTRPYSGGANYWLTELVAANVMGAGADVPVGDFTKAPLNAGNLITDNLLTIADNLSLYAAGGNVGTNKDAGQLFDGAIPGINTSAENWISWMNLTSGDTLYLVYDFGESKTVNRLMVGAICGHSKFPALTLPAYSLFITDSFDDVKSSAVSPLVVAAAGTSGHLYALDEAATGRYLVMKTTTYTHAGQPDYFWCAELGAAYSEEAIEEEPEDTTVITNLTTENASLIPSVNLLAGLPGYAKDFGAADGYTAAVTNGIIGGVTQSEAEEQRPSIGSGDATYAYVTYILPKQTAVDKLLISGSYGDEVNGVYGGITYDNQHVGHYRVYMSDTPNELYSASSLVLDYTNPSLVSGEGVTQLIKLARAVKCRYIGFMLKKGAYEKARISELGAYAATGKMPIGVNEIGALPTDENLLTDAPYKALSGNPQSMQEGTDGIIGRVNVPSNHTNQMSLGRSPKLYYDLGSSKTIDRLLFANNGSDGGGYLCQSYEFYLGDDPDTLFNNAPVVTNGAADNSEYPVNLHVLDTPVTARYVGLTAVGSSKDNLTRIAEVAAYATRGGNATHGAVREDLQGDLLADLTPVVDGNRTTYGLADTRLPDTFVVKTTAAGKVYVSMSAEDLFADENAVADFAAGGDTVTLGQAYEGCYIGFETADAEAAFAAYELSVTVTHLEGGDDYSAENPAPSATVIPGNNLLTGVAPQTYNVSDGAFAAVGGQVENGTDGIIAGINGDVVDTSKMDLGGDTCLVYSLGYRAAVDRLLLAANREGMPHTPDYCEFFVSDTIEDLFTSRSRVVAYANHSHTQGQLFTLSEPVMGRYVGVTAPGTSYGKLRIEELGAYGKKVTDVVQLLHDNHLSRLPAEPSLIAGKTPCNEDANVATAELATDGKFYGLDYGNRYYRAANGMSVYSTPLNATVTYQLDTPALVNKVLVQSFSQVADATKQLRHYSVFVGTDKDTLYTAANRVYIYQNDKASMGQIITLDRPALGRYVGFMFHGDDTTERVLGKSYVFRAGEIGVYGTAATAEETGAQLLTLGTQLRQTDNALRFATAVLTEGNHNSRLIGNTIYHNGEKQTIKTAGTLVVQSDKLGDNQLTINPDGTTPAYVKKVGATYLYDAGEGYAVFTAVVTGIPEAHYGTAISVRGYVVLEDGTVVYGDVYTGSIDATTKAAASRPTTPVEYEKNDSSFNYAEGNLTVSTFNGFQQISFSHTYADGKARVGRIAVPDKVAEGNHWVYQPEFYGHPDAGLAAAVQFVRDGWYLVYLEGISDTYGSPATVKIMEEFQDILVEDFGFFEKAVLLGISRGGLYSTNYALAHPDKVAGLYLDAPVQDICSWPGGNRLNSLINQLYADGKPAGALRDYRTYSCGGSRGMEYSGTGMNEWEGCLKAFGFKDEADAILNDNASPVYHYQELIASGVQVLLQISDTDGLVPPTENGYKMYAAFEAAGKTVRRIHDPADTWLRDGGEADCVLITSNQSGRNGHVHGWHTPADTSAYVRTYMAD